MKDKFGVSWQVVPDNLDKPVAFQIAGQRFVALNGGPQYKFTEAISFVVSCKTQKEIDWMWKK